MTVDKQNKDVCYNDEEHTYWNKDGTFISVTTLIGKFCPKFDKDFWSAYKAIEKLLSKEEFAMVKGEMQKTHRVDVEGLMNIYGFTLNDFNREQQNILDEWQKTNKDSCERGTEIHAILEQQYTSKKTTDLKKYGLGGKFEVNTNKSLDSNGKDLLSVERGVFPEYLIYRVSEDGLFKLAGQIDLLIKDGNDIYIFDYKGLPLDTPILTTKGWKQLCDISKDDLIFDCDGNPTVIKNISEIHHNPCYKITFDNGEAIIADHEHRWVISKYKSKGVYTDSIMTTEEISKWIFNHKNRQSYNILKIKNAKPLNMPNTELPIDPYVLGAWLGDGSKSCGLITQVKESPVWKEIERRGYKLGENAQHSPERPNVEMRTVYGLSTKLKELDLVNNKHIPDIYFVASEQQRLDLLRGFMDTDGYYNKTRKRFVMATGQEWQAVDIAKLVSSLGGKPTIIPCKKYCNGKVFDGWDTCFFLNVNPFLTRNQDIQIDVKKDNHSFRNIISCEPIETVPTKCLEVESKTHTFLAGYNLIVTHNTNAKLDSKSFWNPSTKKNQMMQYPLNNIMDCNKMHYTLQLSTYAWMIQKLNPEFVIKKLMLIHYDHKGNVTEHDVDYLKEDVIRMCSFYKKQCVLQDLKESRKLIEF